jgi:tetratricopeptide (TPR) repeat protein
MGFRFFRRVKIMPGVSLNFSKSGASVSLGGRGMHYTIGPRGRRVTIGIPGTGLSYTAVSSNGRKTRAAKAPEAPSHSPGLLESIGHALHDLTMPAADKAFLSACKAFMAGNNSQALEDLGGPNLLPDAALLGAMICLKQDRLSDAIVYLRQADTRAQELGEACLRLGVGFYLTLHITEEISVHLEPGPKAVLFALVEAHQHRKEWSEAIAYLKRLWQLDPSDPVVRLSLVELYMDAHPGDPSTLQSVAHLTEDIANNSEVEAALLLYRGRALRELNLADAAQGVLGAAIKVRKDRSAELLHALRYELGLTYETLGQPAKARREWEKLYADAPAYADVAHRLGL